MAATDATSGIVTGTPDVSTVITLGEVLESRNPATGELLGTVSVSGPADVEQVCHRAAQAQAAWARRPIRERAAILDRAADHVLYNAEGYADLLRRENGKPRVDALLMEVGPTVDGLRWLARHAPRILAPDRLRPSLVTLAYGMRHVVHHVPLGVVGVIGPSNYPLSIPALDAAAGLVAGNAVVLKPTPRTPLVAERLHEAFRAAGLPEGLFVVVHGGAEQAMALCEAAPVAKVVFTGTVEAGRRVAEACGRHAKSCTLELGGKDPAIVRADADLDRTVPQILWTGCANAGQTCAGVERVYVHESIHDAFVERLVEQARRLVVGDPADPNVDIGPLLDPHRWEEIGRLVDEAVAEGATLRVGGPIEPSGHGRWYAPTVLTGVTPAMRIMREEIFGPVIPVAAYRGDDEAVALANDSRYGLGASIWTRDRAAARRMAERIDAGMVWINEHLYSHAAPMTPWRGAKDSGVGVSHGRYGLRGMTSPKLVSTNYGPLPPAAFPNEPGQEKAVSTILRVFTERALTRRLGTAWRGRDDIGRYLRHRAKAVGLMQDE